MKFAEMILQDERISKKFRIIETDHALKPLAVIFAHSGDSLFWFFGLSILVFTATPVWQYKALLMIVSFIFLAVIVLGIKFTVRRKRPAGEWGQIYRITDPHSFPSGHAARAFLFATLGIGIGPIWMAILLCIWAPLVSLARVGTGVHYMSDVIVGMLVGIFAGVVVLIFLPVAEPWLQLFLTFTH